jgi:type I restriction enzyme, S subunit
MAERRPDVPLASALELVSDIVSTVDVDPDSLFVGTSDLQGLGDLTQPASRVSDSAAAGSRLYRFERGDVLIATARSRESKVWLADSAGYCTTSFTVLRPNGRLDPRHLLWWLRARGAEGSMKRFDFDKERITLPSEGRSVEPVVTLLDQLHGVTELRRRTLATARRLAPAMFQDRLGDPLTEGGVWPTVRVGDVVTNLETGWSPKCADRPARDGEWGVIKVSAVSSGQFRADQNKALPQSTPPREELGLRTGDLLMVRSNTRSLVGVTAVVTHDHPRLLLTDKVWRIRTGGDVAPIFLKALLSYPTVRDRLSRIATGSMASMQNLTQAKVLDLHIALPSPGAQAEHIAGLALVERAERSQLDQLTRLEELLRAVLLTAFSRSELALPGEITVERALFHELSPLHQAIWRALVRADEAVTMPELSRSLGPRLGTVGVDRLRRALNLLTAAGVATKSEDSTFHRWSEALPDDMAGPS